MNIEDMALAALAILGAAMIAAEFLAWNDPAGWLP